jgi:hypothetical protein
MLLWTRQGPWRLTAVMGSLERRVLLILIITVWIVPLSMWGSETPDKIAPLWVTKEVFAAYLNARLDQLLGKERLNERQAEELDFIRKSIDDLRALASFYGMKLKEEKPDKVSSRKEPRLHPQVEKSVAKMPPAGPGTSERLRVRGEPIESVSLEAANPEDSSVSLVPSEERGEVKRVERAEERIANKAKKTSEANPSPTEISLLSLKPEASITAQQYLSQPFHLPHYGDLNDTNVLHKSSGVSDPQDKHASLAHLAIDPDSAIRAEEQMPPPTPVDLVAVEDEVRQFFVSYTQRYTEKDIDGLLGLFSRRAVQNQRDGFDEIRTIYSSFFDQSQELRYHLEDTRIEIYQNAVEARSQYVVDQTLKKGGKRKTWVGNVYWILVKENGALRIRYLNYEQRKSP